MTRSDAVRETFAGAPASLEVFVQFAIDGKGEDHKLISAVEGRGPEAARELLAHIKGLPDRAKCSSTEEFIIGYVPHTDVSDEALRAWDALLAKAFELTMSDVLAPGREPAKVLEFGERLMALIREATDFAHPRLRAWGILRR